jgi:hypothetical protein
MNTNFSQQALQYYFYECLAIIENRNNRRTQAYDNFMTGFNLQNKSFERNLRQTLNDKGDQISEKFKNLIEAKLQSNDFIPENSVEEQNELAAIARAKQFVWPSNEELSIRTQEENNLNQFIIDNPRNEVSDVVKEDFQKYMRLKSYN